MKRVSSKAVHCLDHSWNLCSKEVTTTCDLSRNIVSFIYEQVQLIKFSPIKEAYHFLIIYEKIGVLIMGTQHLHLGFSVQLVGLSGILKRFKYLP